MKEPRIVSREDWLRARRAHLDAEKDLDRQRDALSAARRELPWVRVDDYVFAESGGKISLGDLFGGLPQLVVYHFMYHPDWEDGGCPSCSMLADQLDGLTAHLAARNTALAVVSRASVQQIDAYRNRMGWRFRWVSSAGNRFNEDFHVSFSPDELAAGVHYNYRDGVSFPSPEAPGASVFARDGSGGIFHTYSTYARGLDKLLGVYHFLDMTPAGRDEDALPYPMAWVRRHDEY